jgi:hypothetical protein
MDLLTKVVVSAVIIVAALFALYYGASMIPAAAPTQGQASSNITNYLNMIYPGANVTITDIKPSVYAGSWHVVASVIENATTPCPLYQVYTYDYPAFGLVNGTDNTYTAMNAANCTIYSGARVGSFPVAVALASKNYAVSQYINNFGFANVVTSAIAYNATISGRVMNVWNVSYSSKRANYTEFVVLSQLNGSVLNAARLSK